MKGLSLWHKNARLDEYRTLQSYGVGAGAVIQALTTERDVEAALREEREAEERARTLAERSFGWKANYGMLVSKAEGERRRREAMEQARQQLQRPQRDAKIKAQYEAARANIAPNDTVRDARARRSAAFGEGSARRARATLTRVVRHAPPGSERTARRSGTRRMTARRRTSSGT